VEIELKSISLTIALGLIALGMLWISLTIARGRPCLEGLFSAHKEAVTQANASTVLGIPAVATFALCITLGIVLEDLSKNSLDQRSPTFLDLAVRIFLPQEMASRLSVLFKVKSDLDNHEAIEPVVASGKQILLPDDTAARRQASDDPLGALGRDAEPSIKNDFGCEDWLGEWVNERPVSSTNVILSSTGNEVIHALVDDAKKSSGDLLRGITSLETEMAGNLRFATVCASTGTKPCEVSCGTMRHLYPLYFQAKNYLYRESGRADELELIRHRVDFVRSVFYVMSISVLMLALAMIWRSIAEVRARPIVLVVAFGLLGTGYYSPPIVNVLSTLAFSIWMVYAAWMTREEQLVTPQPHAILVGQSVQARASLSGLAAIKLWRALATLLSIIGATMLVSRAIYLSEMVNYGDRVFGYYATYRALDFHADKEH
jgi:hypothetical protein